MRHLSKLMLVIAVAAAAAACDDATGTSADAGTKKPDAGGCPAAQTCGSMCCSSTQTCSNGSCVDNTGGCGLDQTACGAGCCDSSQVCSKGTCVAKPQCTQDQTACVATCCNAGETCDKGTCKPPAGESCNPIEQTCGTDKSCYWDYEAEAHTCAAAGDVDLGAACEQGSDCVAGADCFDTNDGPICLAYCDPTANPSTCKAEETCYDLQDGTGACVVGGSSGECFPIDDPTGCTGTDACYYDWDTEAYYCGPAGNLADGEECTDDAECVSGLGCDMDGFCAKYCDPAGNDCGAEECIDNGDGTGFCG